MSVRSELLRLALRGGVKWISRPDPDIGAIRRRLEAIKCIVPRPPRDTDETHLSADGLPAVRVTGPRSRDGHHILYLHGGAYSYGSAAHYRDFFWRVAGATAAGVLCIDYRLAPEHPFPAAVDDAVRAYRWLLAQGADPRRVAFMGDSAGGGLAFGALLRLRDERAPMPAAAVGLSPWTDLALSGPSIERNAKADPMLNANQARTFAHHYLAGADPRTPYASPLHGDPSGLPPALIQVGSDEILRDDAEGLASNLRSRACSVELEVWPRMPHVWHLFARVIPEGRRAIERVGDFVRHAFAAA
jgi:acetyl esterase/lipase